MNIDIDLSFYSKYLNKKNYIKKYFTDVNQSRFCVMHSYIVLLYLYLVTTVLSVSWVKKNILYNVIAFMKRLF